MFILIYCLFFNCGGICRYFLHHRIRGLLSCVLKSFCGYFHPGVGFKAVSIKMLGKNIDISQFFGKAKSLLMAKLVEPLNALLGLDFTRATGETLYLFPYFFSDMLLRSGTVHDGIFSSQRHRKKETRAAEKLCT